MRDVRKVLAIVQAKPINAWKYASAERLQQTIADDLRTKTLDAAAASVPNSQDAVLCGCLMLFECANPVVTLGRRALPDDELTGTIEELQARGIQVEHASRGGRATWHGPGQLVAFPVMNLRMLRPHIAGVRQYIDALESAAVETARELGVADAVAGTAATDAAHDFDASASMRYAGTGVWSRGRKLASIGVHVAGGISTHGLAVNLSSEALGYYHAALRAPCGLFGALPTSVDQEVGLERSSAKSSREDEFQAACSALAKNLSNALGLCPIRITQNQIESLRHA